MSDQEEKREKNGSIVSNLPTILTNKTSMSIALVLALMGGAFYSGSQTNRIAYNEKTNIQLTNAIVELKEIAQSNKHRLDYIELQIELQKDEARRSRQLDTDNK